MKMKSIKTYAGLLVIVLVILISGCTNNTPTVDPAVNTENLRIAEIELPGMFCQACAQSSETTFKGMSGVVDANVNIKTKKGSVVYDSSIITKDQLIQDGLIQAYDGKILNDQAYSP